MTASVPESDLTSDQLLRIGGFDRSDADALDSALNNGGGGGVVLYNVLDYGTIDTPANTRTAILAAAAAAHAAGGGTVYMPGGTYTVDRDGANAWCIDWPYSGVSLLGDFGRTIIQAQAGMPNASVAVLRMDERSDILVKDIIIDGNWGNRITEIAEGSHNVAVSTLTGSATLYVEDTSNMANSGTVTIGLEDDNYVYVTYTSKTAVTLLNCTVVTGGTGTLARHNPVVYQNSNAGLNHASQTDPKNYGIMLRGCARIRVEGCTFRQCYGDGIWMGCPSDDDLFVPTRDVRITNCIFDTNARNGISFGAIVERICIDHNRITNFWTTGIDGEPQGFDGWNRDVLIHHNFIASWPLYPSGGTQQAIGCVSGTPQGYNQSSAARGWRIHDNVLHGWTAINNAIDVCFSRNQVRTRGYYIGDNTVTAINTGTETFTANDHGMKNGDGPLWLLTDGALPAGVTASGGNPLRSIDYYAIKVDANNFKIATTFALAIAGTTDVNVTDTGSGTLTLTGPKPTSPVYVDHTTDDIRIIDNYIYDLSEKTVFSGEGNNGAITIANYGGGNANLQPAGVLVADNVIKAYKGCHGIYVNAVGAFSIGDGTAVVAPASGTATSVSRNTLVKTGAGWTVNQWVGWQVIAGGKIGLVLSNTSDTLTLYTPDLPIGAAIGWRLPSGEWTTAPTGTPTYVITSNSGVLSIRGNAIDCGAYGSNTAGGNGIYLFNDRSGARIEVLENKIKNANGWGIFVAGATAKPILSLDIRGNRFWDDQAVATTSAGIRYSDAQSLTSVVKLSMANNSNIGGISTLLSNVTTGYWLVSDGDVQQWAGFGSPNGVITAPIGSTYQRKDGGAGTSFYVNENGGTTWAAK